MVFGLGTKEEEAKKAKSEKNVKSKKKTSQSDEAAEILKKMEAKKDDGECAFC